MKRTRVGAGVLAIGLLVAALSVVGGSPASATGKHGPVTWPAGLVSCSYTGRTLSRVKVVPPRVSMDKALARKGGRSQYVGVRAVLQGLRDGRWKKVAKRPKKRGYAATVLVHPRKMRSVKHARLLTFDGAALPSAYTSFRVKVTLQWYAYNGHTIRGHVARTSNACVRTKPVVPYVVDIRAGASHACARMSNGSMRCWGAGWNGDLGRGTTSSSTRPVTPIGMASGVTGIGVGAGYACAVQAQTLKCWGKDDQGQLGIGRTSTSPVSSPTRVRISGVRAVVAGAGTTCASLGAGGLSCWGGDSLGQVGTGVKTAAGVASPARIGATTMPYTVTSLASGSDQACGVMGGNVYCWGNNAHQQMRSAADSSAHVPTKLSTAGNISAVASGLAHVCAIASGGELDCWGSGAGAALGNGSTADTAATVHPTGLTSGVTAVSAYGTSTCAVRAGRVYCWGQNAAGQLGTGDTNVSAAPHPLGGISGAVGVAVGNDAGYAWDRAGNVWAWGSNAYGQFGNGTTSSVGQPLLPHRVSIH